MAVNLREEEAYLEGVKEALKAVAERLAEKMHYYSDASGSISDIAGRSRAHLTAVRNVLSGRE